MVCTDDYAVKNTATFPDTDHSLFQSLVRQPSSSSTVSTWTTWTCLLSQNVNLVRNASLQRPLNSMSSEQHFLV